MTQHHHPPPARPRSVVVELRVAPPSARLVLAGELDVLTSQQVVAALGAATIAGMTHLVVDLRAVEFAGAEALGALAETAEILAVRGGKVELVGARPIHARVLRIFGAPEALVLDAHLDGPDG